MPNNCLSVLYKRIIQVENKNVGLKVGGGGGGAQSYHCPPNQKSGGGGHMPPLPPPLPTPVLPYNNLPTNLPTILLVSSYRRVGTSRMCVCVCVCVCVWSLADWLVLLNY